MPKNVQNTCTECGARLVEGAAQCGLCGWPVDAPEAAEDFSIEAPIAETAATAPSSPPEAVAVQADGPVQVDGVFCNQCGWKNPPAARFCSMCGASLQALAASSPTPPPVAAPEATLASAAPSLPSAPPVPPAQAAPSTPPDRGALTRQVGIIVGAGVLLVVALFLVTAVSKTRPPAPATPQAGPPAVQTPPPATPLAGPVAEQAAALEAEIAQLSGAERLARQRDLVALFAGAGQLDRAAREQQTLAQATDDVDDWRRAGDLAYDWMMTLQDGPQKTQVATQAIEAYQRVLAQDPDNLDVRTDMATAYLSSSSPMQGVTEIKRVLDANPDHLHARFNYGIMLSMIGRAELALEQFEYVKTLVDESSRYYQQADEAIRALRQGGNL